MHQVVIVLILDLSITEYFDSLKKFTKKRYLASGQKTLEILMEQQGIGFKGDSEEDLKHRRPKGKSLVALEQTL